MSHNNLTGEVPEDLHGEWDLEFNHFVVKWSSKAIGTIIGGSVAILVVLGLGGWVLRRIVRGIAQEKRAQAYSSIAASDQDREPLSPSLQLAGKVFLFMFVQLGP